MTLAAPPAADLRKLALWETFCSRHAIAYGGVPLFATDGEGRVRSAPYGRDGRVILQRAPEMETLLVGQVERVLGSPAVGPDRLEGILYLMFRRAGDRGVLPLYIGRAGRFGRGDGNVSANLADIRRNGGRFARWGSGYAYHIGDLSAAACPGHPGAKCSPKYRRWADRLFADAPAPSPRLREPVFFWATAWGPSSPSIWAEFGPCSLAFQEYLLIGVAAECFPGELLNEEGVNRRTGEEE